jgi:hypothetical protein
MFCSILFCYFLGRLSLRFRLHSVCWYIQNCSFTARHLLNLMKNQRKINDFGSPAGRLGHLWVLSGRHVCDPRKPRKQTEGQVVAVFVGHIRYTGWARNGVNIGFRRFSITFHIGHFFRYSSKLHDRSTKAPYSGQPLFRSTCAALPPGPQKTRARHLWVPSGKHFCDYRKP